MVLVLGQDAGVLPAIVSSSGDRLVLLWGSSGWMGACSAVCWVSSVLRAFTGSGSAALIHYRWFWWWLVDATICATDMRRRYGATTIWCDDMQGRKTEKAKSVLLLALILFVIRYFTFVV
jgi:hypothetical protein